MDVDQITRVSSQSWFSRIGDSLKGIVFGLLLVLVSFPLLFWNESRAVSRARTLTEGAGAVVSVDTSAVDPGNEGALVHVSGRTELSSLLADEEFGVSTPSLKLERAVEMYQWRERSESKETDKLGGSTETVTTYTYERTWSRRLIDSSEFEQPEGHGNPSTRPFASREWVADDVRVGAFVVPEDLLGQISNSSRLPVQTSQLPEALAARAQVLDGRVYLGADPAQPQIGDVRVSFHHVPPTEVSIVAAQSGAALVPFATEAGGEIRLLETGLVDAAAMFQSAQTSNRVLTWILRGVGFVIMWIGFGLILSPLAVIADVVPIFGSIVGAGIGFVTFLIAAVLSLITIAMAWLVARPLLGLTILAVAGVLLWLVRSRVKNAEPVTPDPAAV